MFRSILINKFMINQPIYIYNHPNVIGMWWYPDDMYVSVLNICMYPAPSSPARMQFNSANNLSLLTQWLLIVQSDLNTIRIDSICSALMLYVLTFYFVLLDTQQSDLTNHTQHLLAEPKHTQQ